MDKFMIKHKKPEVLPLYLAMLEVMLEPFGYFATFGIAAGAFVCKAMLDADWIFCFQIESLTRRAEDLFDKFIGW